MNAKEKQTFWCTDNHLLLPISGAFVVLLGLSLFVLYFVIRGFTSSLHHVQGAVPTYVVAVLLMISGVFVALLYFTKSRYFVTIAVFFTLLCVLVNLVQFFVILSSSIPFLEEVRCIRFPKDSQCQCHLEFERTSNHSKITFPADSDPHIFQDVKTTCEHMEKVLTDFLIIFCIIYCFGAVACIFLVVLSCLLLAQSKQDEKLLEGTSERKTSEHTSQAVNQGDAESQTRGTQSAAASTSDDSNNNGQTSGATAANKNIRRSGRVQRSASISSTHGPSNQPRISRHHSIATADISPSHQQNSVDPSNQSHSGQQPRTHSGNTSRQRMPPLLIQGGYLQGQVNGPTIPVYTLHGTNETYISLTDLPSLHMQVPSLQQSMPAYLPEPVPEEEPPPYTQLEASDDPPSFSYGGENEGYTHDSENSVGINTEVHIDVVETCNGNQHQGDPIEDEATGQIIAHSPLSPDSDSPPSSTESNNNKPNQISSGDSSGPLSGSNDSPPSHRIVSQELPSCSCAPTPPPTSCHSQPLEDCSISDRVEANEQIEAANPLPGSNFIELHPRQNLDSQPCHAITSQDAPLSHRRRNSQRTSRKQIDYPKKNSDGIQMKETKRKLSSHGENREGKLSSPSGQLGKSTTQYSDKYRKSESDKKELKLPKHSKQEKVDQCVPETLPKIRTISSERTGSPGKELELSWLRKGAKPKKKTSQKQGKGQRQQEPESRKSVSRKTKKGATVSKSSNLGSETKHGYIPSTVGPQDSKYTKHSSKPKGNVAVPLNRHRKTSAGHDIVSRDRSHSPSKRRSSADGMRLKSHSKHSPIRTDASSSESLTDLVNLLESARDFSMQPKATESDRKRRSKRLKQNLKDSKI